VLKDLPVWSFLLSTQLNTEYLSPPPEAWSSGRVIQGNFRILEPFLALPLDVAASEAMVDDYDAELIKPMSKFSTVEHITLFGRPLWLAYRDIPNCLRTFAQLKIARFALQFQERVPGVCHSCF
jgi:hypothetical protein